MAERVSDRDQVPYGLCPTRARGSVLSELGRCGGLGRRGAGALRWAGGGETACGETGEIGPQALVVARSGGSSGLARRGARGRWGCQHVGGSAGG